MTEPIFRCLSQARKSDFWDFVTYEQPANKDGGFVVFSVPPEAENWSRDWYSLLVAASGRASARLAINRTPL